MSNEIPFNDLVPPSSLYGFEWVRKAERLGFIKSTYRDGRLKYYDPSAIKILRKVKYLRLLGYSIPKIRNFILNPSKDEVARYRKAQEVFMKFVEEESK